MDMGRTTRSRARLACVVGCCAVAVLAVTSCQTGRWTGTGEHSVSVIGDSLVYQAEGNVGVKDQRVLADELAASGYRAHVSGWIGETIATGYVDLWPEVAHDPELDVLVIALGTNDVGRDIPLEESRAALRQWLAETGAVGCVALVGVNEAAFGWELDVYGPAFNAMLAEEAAALPNGLFVPWVPDLDIHGYHGDVHFETPEAQAQYRATLHDAVDRCASTLEPAETTTTTTEPETTTTTTEPETTTTTTEPETTTTTGG
jgi:lysophospholipase L1-like esterase